MQVIIEQYAKDGPQMRRGTNDDGTPWMGSMRECLQDEIEDRGLAEKEIDRLTEAQNRLCAEAREEMRKECIAACENERHSKPTSDYGHPYNDAIDDVTAKMREIK
jgi:hypothetical protein